MINDEIMAPSAGDRVIDLLSPDDHGVVQDVRADELVVFWEFVRMDGDGTNHELSECGPHDRSQFAWDAQQNAWTISVFGPEAISNLLLNIAVAGHRS